MAGTDFSHLTSDELINGIQALNLPDYIRSKAYGIDVRETLAQMTEMTIQLGVNMGLSPDDALKWARKLQESVSQSDFDSWVATLLDGGPSIFMNTLTELQTTYPNGAAGVALVRETDPAKIYVWNGSAWEDFGAYQGIVVADGSITSSKIADGAITTGKIADGVLPKFEYLGENLYSIEQVTDDSYIDPEGHLYPANNWSVAKVPLKGAGKYSIWRKNVLMTEPTLHGGYRFENASGVQVASPISYVASSYTYDLQKWSIIDVPIGADFVYINVRGVYPTTTPMPDDRNSTYFVKGEVVNESILKGTLKSVNGASVTPTDTISTSRYKAKNWVVVGDSITEKNFRSTLNYHDYISEWLGVDVVNLGYSGTGYSNTFNTVPKIPDRLNSIPAYADIITVFAGTNDISMPLGAYGDIDKDASTYGAIDYTLKTLIEKFPTKTIAVFTPLPRSTHWGDNNMLQKIADAVIETSNKYSIPCLDLYRNGGLRPWNAVNNKEYFSSDASPEGDGLHPNEKGQLLIAYKIYEFMKTL